MDEYLSTTGRVFNIQRFSVHDGPGIRTIVFLKGCVLRCRWCCNPEGQRFETETMVRGGKTETVGRDTTVGEILDTVLKDRRYYERSGGGGLTLSGGECLCQPAFARDLLRAAKESGLSTAIESTAVVPWDSIAGVLPYLDYFLMDIKHMDSAKHKEFTGQPNERILANAQKLARQARELIIRVPVIPGFNDTPGEITAIARFTAGLGTVSRLHLLPYHRLGQDKYSSLGRPYMLEGVLPPEDAHMQALKAAAEQAAPSLQVQIGG